jgi:glycosyltransferase involved in cell wall biosynthesis
MNSPSVDAPIDFSIVIPVYNNAGSLTATMTALQHEVIAHYPQRRGEVVFIDDGSADSSLAELLLLREQNPDLVRVIKLTRNFGQPAARLAGLSAARGACIISMSADGQDPASLINDMLRAHWEEGYTVVVCARTGRDEPWSRVVTSRIFYALMRRLSFPNMPAGGFDFVLLGRAALDVILRNFDAQPFFQGQILWTGYRPKIIEYRRRERKIGRSGWTFTKRLTLLIDGVLGYSFTPIRLMSLTGVAFAALGFAAAAVILLRRVLRGTHVAGWSSIVALQLIIGGLVMLMLGVIGEYVWRALSQTRRRDLYVVERVYEKTPPPAPHERP